MGSDVTGFSVLLSGGIGTTYDTEMLEADPVLLGDAPRCDACDFFVGGKPWLPPHRAELTLHGQQWGDFAFRGDGGEDILITERAARLYRSAMLSGLSGFETVDITRHRGGIVPPPPYVHVAVGRSEAVIDDDRSTLIRSSPPTCDRCRSTTLEGIRGFVLKDGSWGGEDVFFPRGLTGVVVASSRFVEFVREHDLSNVRFIPTEAYEWDPYAPVVAGS